MKCPNCGKEIDDMDDGAWVYCDEDGSLRYADTGELVKDDD